MQLAEEKEGDMHPWHLYYHCYKSKCLNHLFILQLVSLNISQLTMLKISTFYQLSL